MTLVEMLVAVALLVLMMTIIVTIFAAATGAVSGLQTYQQLDSDLRQLDITIRQDLLNTTSPMTPPVDPQQNRGYFEYIENAFADLQGEDTDDCLRFTTKAPEGQLFQGKIWLSALSQVSNSLSPQPVITTSQFAEIIYFLRNGNLYRRVLLVAPEKQAAVNTVTLAFGSTSLGSFVPANLGGNKVSWQGVNDLSGHPAPSGSDTALTHPIILNTLGDLTNRENRWPASRWANDYLDNLGLTANPDGIPDDQNLDSNMNQVGDSVPDYYPTLYFGVPTKWSGSPNPLIFEPTSPGRVATADSMAFPYIYPGMYSQPDVLLGQSTSGAGWIHSTDANPATAFANLLDQQTKINHAPLPPGAGADSLPDPTGSQTWWGFPTWRETLSPNWKDPYWLLPVNSSNTPGQQANGLHPFDASFVPSPTSAIALSNYLPPMTAAYRTTQQLHNDGAGGTNPLTSFVTPALWSSAWDDDLLMTGVRSFDIKAYDDAYPGYVDLGWGDDLRVQPPNAPGANLSQNLGATLQLPAARTVAPFPGPLFWNGGTYDLLSTFAHEGRMPPLINDYRGDAQFPALNIGDNNVKIQRLRRVWDSWSTDYTTAPATGVDPDTKLPIGPPWSTRPIYPSYPAPYPAPLRGIQIQIRVVDPKSERTKVLTIRQEFTDKL